MSGYRLYYLNPGTGRIESFEPVTASNDDEAIVIATGLGGARAMELWQQARLIRSWEQRKA